MNTHVHMHSHALHRHIHVHIYTVQAHTYTRHPSTPTHNTETPACEEGTVANDTKVISTFILLKNASPELSPGHHGSEAHVDSEIQLFNLKTTPRAKTQGLLLSIQQAGKKLKNTAGLVWWCTLVTLTFGGLM